jgi:hypothetical protein
LINKEVVLGWSAVMETGMEGLAVEMEEVMVAGLE